MDTITYQLSLKSAVIISFIAISIFVLFPGINAALPKPTDGKQITLEDEKFDRIFREGRDLIDKEEWAKAAEKFKQIVCDCPENKNVDAAFYWLAFCQKKLRQFKEANDTLKSLLGKFPNSSWADDARVMQLEIQPELGRSVYSTSPLTTISGSGVSQSTSNGVTNIWTTGSYPDQKPLDREDEIKLAAFQSLFSADPKRGIEVLGDILKTDSKASETLKREVLRTLRSPRLLTAQPGQGVLAYSTTSNKINSQLIPLLRETLVKSYQNESNVKIRTEIIYSLANINDEQSVNYIVQLYSSETNKEIKKAIINSFGGSSFHYFYSYSGLVTTNTPEPETKTITSNSNSISKIYFDKLMEIIRIEKDIELRRLAFSNLQRFAGWSAKEGIIETLSQMYDSETDDEFKLSIIQSFAWSKQKQATTKLLNIAKSDKSDKMRIAAIRSLQNSKDPEVLKFLEDLIK